jgi:hypothetical protein
MNPVSQKENSRMKTHKGLLAVTAGGLLAFTLYASQSSAHGWSCPVGPATDTTFWENATRDYTCFFNGFGNEPTARVKSWSFTQDGIKKLMVDLVSTTGIPSGHFASARGRGLTMAGAEIAGCDTGLETSTGANTTVTDASGCDSAAKHRLYASFSDNPPH